MITEALVGPQRRDDDDVGKLRMGSYGELMISDMNGFFFEQVMRGNGYVFSNVLAGAAPIVAATGAAQTPSILNPAQSGRLLVVQKITFNRTAVGTPVEGGIVYSKTPISSIIGTGADIVSGTLVAAVNLRPDLGDNSGMKFFPTTMSITPAPTYFANSGISQIASTGTATGVNQFNDIDYINGLIQMPPGWMFTINASAAIATTYSISIFALSLPMPLTSQ